jgi:hypothetical protein
MVENLVAHWDEIALVVTSLVSIAGVVTAITPTPKDDAVLLIIRKVLDVLALNVAHAKNAK